MYMYSHTLMRMYRQMTQTDRALIKEENAGPEVHQVTTSLPITKHCSKDCEKHHMKCTALRQLPKIC